MPQKLLTLLFLLLGVSQYAQVVINEIDADTPSSDLLEFVELKSDTPNFSLDGYVLVFFNETNTSCYYAYDLDGFATDINGIAHFGNNQVTPSPLGIFSNGRIQNGPDVVALYLGDASDFQFAVQPGTIATTTNLVDALAYSNNNTPPTNLMAILGLSVFTNENATASVTTHSIQRKNDGTYEVKSPTPGVNNDGSGVVLNYITVTIPQNNYIEGEEIPITFTTSQPVSGTDLIFNFTIVNGNFMVNDYAGTNLTVSIPVGLSTAQNSVYLFDDTTDEGDEEMLIDLQALPFGYVANNDNILIRIYDNDYVVQTYGTPLNPTYGLVTPTIPAGYYDSLEGLSGNALKQAVQDIIANPAVVRAHNYGDIEFILKEADKNPLNSNQVWQMYVESPKSILDYQTGSSNIGVWNREHIFPQSRGGFSGGTSSTADGIGIWLPTNADDILAGHADAHHLRAEDGAENSTRSNRDYGSDYNGPTGSQGSWNGDVARALFYMAVRYNGLNLVNGNPSDAIVGQMGDLATLLTWNSTDPSDDFEMNRNNYIYTWQMNRNPFIDYPNLADYIFGANFGQPWSSTLSTQNPIENRIAIYPNPASDYLIVSGLEGTSKVEIFTITGQLVKRQDFDNEIQINLDLISGMYLVKVTNGLQSTTKKIVIK
ncbi:T9SS type A sorting domain-containing protein [Flavobacterium sp. LMO8]|uniref:endonuclease n=1 Tax=Flavobacterium sp. LMO8 TaxID=2654244 RepID=UPI001292A26A|nr:endonuclease [Flavobacterium sp. LMO8]MQP23619.1 T9SS type A sorting domain-containing protein [Flavobacterium sp. LMO8]